MSTQANHRFKVAAVHAAGHAVMLALSPYHTLATVETHEDRAGASNWHIQDRARPYSKDAITWALAVALGGRTAEAITFDKVSELYRFDSKFATTLTLSAICTWGMPFLSHIDQTSWIHHPQAPSIYRRMDEILESARQLATSRLKANGAFIAALSQRLADIGLERSVMVGKPLTTFLATHKLEAEPPEAWDMHSPTD